LKKFSSGGADIAGKASLLENQPKGSTSAMFLSGKR